MLGGGCTFLTTHGLRLGADFCGAISSVGTGDVPMAARLSCALLVCAAASISATFVCGGDVQITHSWDGKSIEGHCDGDYEGAEFMPGDRVPFPDGPLLSGTLPAKLALNSGIETLWLKNNLISGTMAQEQSHLGDHPIRVGWDEDVEGAGPVWRAPLGHCSDPAWASGRDDDAQLVLQPALGHSSHPAWETRQSHTAGGWQLVVWHRPTGGQSGCRLAPRTVPNHSLAQLAAYLLAATISPTWGG